METEQSTAPPEPLNLADMSAVDEGCMQVHFNGVPINWYWWLAGPGHPMGEAQAARVSKEARRLNRSIQNAQANNRRWTAPEDNGEDIRESNVNWVMERFLRWTPDEQKFGPDLCRSSPENARKLLLDPRYGWLLDQLLEFLRDVNSFTRRSEKNSRPSPSATST